MTAEKQERSGCSLRSGGSGESPSCAGEGAVAKGPTHVCRQEGRKDRVDQEKRSLEVTPWS